MINYNDDIQGVTKAEVLIPLNTASGLPNLLTTPTKVGIGYVVVNDSDAAKNGTYWVVGANIGSDGTAFLHSN